MFASVLLFLLYAVPHSNSFNSNVLRSSAFGRAVGRRGECRSGPFSGHIPLNVATEDAAGLSVDGKPVSREWETPPGIAQPPKLSQRWRKSTKQLATLGPASSSKEMIEKLFLAGE